MKKNFFLFVLALLFPAKSFSTGMFNWGKNASTSAIAIKPILVHSDTNWKCVSSTNNFVCAIKTDGTLWAYGSDYYGQLGDGAGKAGLTFQNYFIIGSDNNWAQIFTGSYFTVALKTDSSLWAWGYNYYGQVGNNMSVNQLTPANIAIGTKWRKVSCGSSHSLAIKSDGSLWAWGYNYYGQLGDGSTSNRNHPILISSDTTWKDIACSNTSSFAIKSDGSLWAWGYNRNFDLGNNDSINALVPIQIGSDNNWEQMSCGYSFTFATKIDGSIWGWGDNTYGQLGDGTTDRKKIPTQISYDLDWKKISCGSRHSLALKIDGSLWGWGDNSYNEVNSDTLASILAPTLIDLTNTWKDIKGGNYQSFGFRDVDNNFCETPVISTPEDYKASLGLSLNLAWYKSFNAIKYRINVASDSNFTQLLKSATLSDTSTSIGNLSLSTKYYWRVKAYCGTDSSYWSNIAHFTTAKGKPNPPTLGGPSKNATNVQLSAEISVIASDANLVRFQFSTSPDVSSPLADFLYPSTSTFVNAYIYLKVLKYNTTYYWRAKTINGYDSSDWSDTWSFTTLVSPISTPILVKPTYQATNVELNPKFKWEISSTVLSFRVQVSKSNTFSDFVHNDSTNSSEDSISGLEAATTYYWRVKAFAQRDSSEWSSVWAFTTIAGFADKPILSLPINNSKNLSNNVSMAWNSVQNAIQYKVQVSFDSTFVAILNDGITNNTNYSISGLPDSIYYWRVKAYSASDSSNWSSVWNFQVGTNGVKDIIEPANFIHITPNPAQNIVSINNLPENPAISITNLFGETIISKTATLGNGILQVDLSNFANGTYYCIIYSNNKTEVKKFVLVK